MLKQRPRDYRDLSITRQYKRSNINLIVAHFKQLYFIFYRNHYKFICLKQWISTFFSQKSVQVNSVMYIEDTVKSMGKMWQSKLLEETG